jgi:hypothetical protein
MTDSMLRTMSPIQVSCPRRIVVISGAPAPRAGAQPDRGDDAHHGRTGPFPIRHLKYDDLTTSLRGFVDAAKAEGFAGVEGFNGPNPAG